VIGHRGGSRRSMTPPSGWAAVPGTDRSNAKEIRIHAWFKVAGASEPASYTFTLTGGAGVDISGGVFAVSGAGPSPINASGGQSNGGASSAVSAPSITTTAPSALLVFGGACNNASSFTPPTGMTEQWDRATTGSGAVATETATANFPDAGATGIRTATASAACRSAGIQVAVTP
jgi:MSHA biogenesis protein MshQ